jgi:inosose dehydratase
VRETTQPPGGDGARLAVGPISWGVCEVPGWGEQLPPARVLGEIRALGIRAVEAGPVGYLGADAATVSRVLADHDLELAGGFVPVVLHDRHELADTLADAERIAVLYAAAGADVLVSALPVDRSWSPRVPLDDRAWSEIVDGLSRLDELAARHGLRHVLHPHVGTLVETEADLVRVLESSDVALCLDTGHLLLGGTDPARLAREAPARIAHVHLKDVRLPVAVELRAGTATLLEATRRGLFCPLGAGGAPVADTVLALAGSGYRGWYVIEQDTTLDEAALPRPDEGPVVDTRRSIAFLDTLLDLDHRAVRPAPAREVSGTPS